MKHCLLKQTIYCAFLLAFIQHLAVRGDAAISQHPKTDISEDVKKAAESQPESKPAANSKVQSPSKDRPAKKRQREFSPAIADNSFFIEEAYNQEAGVVQHISTCTWYRYPQNNLSCNITQEWPLGSEKHQLSYTVPFSFLNSNSVRGIDDVLINYRYQLFDEKHRAAVSPRISLIIPSGNVSRGLGSGSLGVQLNFPVSKRLSEHFVTHFNAGATFLPRVKWDDGAGTKSTHNIHSYNLGGSGIWLLKNQFNLMLEYQTSFLSEINSSGAVTRFNEYLINPGFRFAVNLRRVQMVPGLGVPISFRQGEINKGLFFYLSFEHAFRKEKK